MGVFAFSRRPPRSKRTTSRPPNQNNPPTPLCTTGLFNSLIRRKSREGGAPPLRRAKNHNEPDNHNEINIENGGQSNLTQNSTAGESEKHSSRPLYRFVNRSLPLLTTWRLRSGSRQRKKRSSGIPPTRSPNIISDLPNSNTPNSQTVVFPLDKYGCHSHSDTVEPRPPIASIDQYRNLKIGFSNASGHIPSPFGYHVFKSTTVDSHTLLKRPRHSLTRFSGYLTPNGTTPYLGVPRRVATCRFTPQSQCPVDLEQVVSSYNVSLSPSFTPKAGFSFTDSSPASSSMTVATVRTYSSPILRFSLNCASANAHKKYFEHLNKFNRKSTGDVNPITTDREGLHFSEGPEISQDGTSSSTTSNIHCFPNISGDSSFTWRNRSRMSESYRGVEDLFCSCCQVLSPSRNGNSEISDSVLQSNKILEHFPGASLGGGTFSSVLTQALLMAAIRHEPRC